MLCMLKQVEGLKVKITFNPFNIYNIGWYGWKSLSLRPFENFFRIENHLNIKKIMSKTVKASFDPFDMSNMSNN